MADYGQAPQSRTAPPPARTMISGLQSLQEIEERLHKMIGRMATLGDHIGGVRPREVAKTTDQAMPDNQIGILNARLASMQMLCATLEEEISRVESYVVGV